MTARLRTRTGPEWLAEHRRRLEDAERRTRTTQSNLGRERRIEVLTFSQSGPTTVSTSGPDEVRTSGQLEAVIVRLRVAGTTNTVVTIYRNGTSIGTVTLASGVKRNAKYLGSFRITAETDEMTVGVTTAGTGADSVTVRLPVRS